jgi:hypothetical protein
MIRNLTILCARSLIYTETDLSKATADVVEIINDCTIEYDRQSLAATYSLLITDSYFKDDNENPVFDLATTRRRIKDLRLMRFLHYVVLNHGSLGTIQKILGLYDMASHCYTFAEIYAKTIKVTDKFRKHNILEKYETVDHSRLFE